MKVNCDPVALPAEKGAKWIGRGWPSLAWWGGDDHVRFLAYTLFFGFMYLLRPRERDTPEHVPAAVKFDSAVKIRTARVLFSYFVQLGSFFLPFKARPTLALINPPLYCIPARNLSTAVSYTPTVQDLIRTFGYGQADELFDLCD